MDDRSTTMGAVPAVVANLLIGAIIGSYALLSEFNQDVFYRSVQEDEWLEWASVWAFLAGMWVFARAALDQRKQTQQLPWFLAGIALFCFLVAMEEMSWGQRLIGYRPPVYFLENNFQQEFNVHNVMDSDFRKLGMKVLLLGYGVAFPLVTLLGAVRRPLRRFAIEAPPAALIPAFLLSYFVYEEYPLKFTGEIVEFMLGLSFCFAGIAVRDAVRGAETAGTASQLRSIALSTAIVSALGLANTAYTQMSRSASPELLKAAAVELAALRDDFKNEARRRHVAISTRCGLHKRLYSYKEKYQANFLRSGRFVDLVSQGMPEERAEFLLDPWNYPYWIRDNCKGDRISFVYSFGPNRLRDSGRREIRSDDLGRVLFGSVMTPPRELDEEDESELDE